MRVDYEDLDYSDDALTALYRDKPFTGVAFELDKEGRVEREVSFVDGQRTGPRRIYHPSGKLAAEEPFYLGVLHGLGRHHDDRGHLTSEVAYELGIKTWERRFDEAGRVVEEFRLQEETPRYKSLQLARGAYPNSPRVPSP